MLRIVETLGDVGTWLVTRKRFGMRMQRGVEALSGFSFVPYGNFMHPLCLRSNFNIARYSLPSPLLSFLPFQFLFSLSVVSVPFLKMSPQTIILVGGARANRISCTSEQNDYENFTSFRLTSEYLCKLVDTE